jgi:hypothetical protein
LPQLRHKLALARAGLVDGPLEYSTEHRSKLLRKLEQSWSLRELQPRRQLKIPLDSKLCTRYQISSGVVVSGILTRNSSVFQELQVYRLPSYLTGLKSKLWRHELVEANAVHFKVDSTQDLLVLLEYSGTRDPAYNDCR